MAMSFVVTPDSRRIIPRIYLRYEEQTESPLLVETVTPAHIAEAVELGSAGKGSTHPVIMDTFSLHFCQRREALHLTILQNASIDFYSNVSQSLQKK